MRAKFSELLNTWFARAILFSIWAIIVSFATGLWYSRLDVSPTSAARVDALLAIFASALPYILTYWVSRLLTKRSQRISYKLSIGEIPPISQSSSKLFTRSAEDLWEFECDRAQASLKRASDYAYLFGLLASVVATFCTIGYMVADKHMEELISLTIAVGVAVMVYFAICLGSFLQRLANADAGAQLFAHASRNLLLIVPSAFLIAGLLSNNDTIKKLVTSSELGSALLGVAIGILGERIFGEVNERAANLLGIKNLTPSYVSDLRRIDGLNDEDVARLSEEGIDSVHSLAFAPTPRLFFSTIYSLQCLCDWQDQALLIEYAGQSRAQTFREKFMVRGAVDARMIANQLLLPREKTIAGAIALQDQDVDDFSKILGFNTVNQLRLALLTLANDEIITRLEIYYRSVAKAPEAVPPEEEVKVTHLEKEAA
jgi:hypothetical protein